MSIYYPPTQNAIQKTLDAQLLEGITASMTLNNVVGIANEPGVCVVDFVDTNNLETPTKREYIAFTGVSGNTLTGLTRNADGGGTDQDHAVGAIVQFPSDILQQKAIIDGLLETVDTDGALDTTKVVDLITAQTLTNKTLTSPVINTPTGDVATLTGTQTLTNKTLTSPKINEDVALTATATQLNTATNAWATWNPSWSNLTVGSGTVVARYCQIGKTVCYTLSVIFAADTSIGGAVDFSLPVTSRAYVQYATPVGQAIFKDYGYGSIFGTAVFNTTTKARIVVQASDLTFLYTADLSSSAPITWTTNDAITVNGVYEAA